MHVPADSASGSADSSEPALPAESAPQMTQPPAEEIRVVGHVKWHIYQRYMKAVGTGLVLFVPHSLTLMQA